MENFSTHVVNTPADGVIKTIAIFNAVWAKKKPRMMGLWGCEKCADMWSHYVTSVWQTGRNATALPYARKTKQWR